MNRNRGPSLGREGAETKPHFASNARGGLGPSGIWSSELRYAGSGSRGLLRRFPYRGAG